MATAVASDPTAAIIRERIPFSFQQEGRWSIEHDSGKRIIHYKLNDAQIAPFGQDVREAVQRNPGFLEALQQGAFEDWASEILQWQYGELRTRDIEF